MANLPMAVRVPLAPQNTSGSDFLRSIRLRVGAGLRMAETGWISLGYLFERFSRKESYERFREFFFTRIDWERHRVIVFMVAFLGVMVFPMRKNRISIYLLPTVIFMCRGSVRTIIVPMILAEIFRSLVTCSRGSNFFRGCNASSLGIRTFLS